MASDLSPQAALREDLVRKIKDLVKSHPKNRDEAQGRFFEEPLVGFASAEDSLFAEFKRIIGPFHWTPSEVLEQAALPGGARAGTVVSWVLPVSQRARRANAGQEAHPSREWARTRDLGEKFNDFLREEATRFIASRGGLAAAPMRLPAWKEVRQTRAGIASTWSERHAAYAAGLGTFGLNGGFITPLGIAHRLGSVVTDVVMEPSERIYRSHMENCLAWRGIQCGACIGRCPAGAVSAAGHDKDRCERYYQKGFSKLRKEYGVSVTGCGLCQTGVPCESSIPREDFPKAGKQDPGSGDGPGTGRTDPG